MAQLGGTFAALATLLLLVEQYRKERRDAKEQGKLNRLAIVLQTQNSRISEAKAIIEMLWKGDSMPLERQAVPNEEGEFENLEAQLERMINGERQLEIARRQVRIWRDAVSKRNDAITEMEKLTNDTGGSASGKAPSIR